MARRARNRGEDDSGRGKRRRGPGIGVRRMLGLAAFLPIASRAPLYGRLLWELLRDERMPASRKAILAAALGYVAVGHDLVRDEVPVIGGLDDLIVVLLAVDVFLDGVPQAVLDEKLDELDIDRRTFREDLSRIRRFTPGPVRRVIRRVPGAIGFAADAVKHSGVGPRVRRWVNDKEGSSA